MGKMYCDFSEAALYQGSLRALLGAMGRAPTQAIAPSAERARWYCSYCGWGCVETFNDYLCKACGAVRITQIGSATVTFCAGWAKRTYSSPVTVVLAEFALDTARQGVPSRSPPSRSIPANGEGEARRRCRSGAVGWAVRCGRWELRAGWFGPVRPTTSAALGSPRRDASPLAAPSLLL